MYTPNTERFSTTARRGQYRVVQKKMHKV